jgi:hypothetical protein
MSCRRLIIKCWTKRKSREWLDHLRKLMATEVARGFIGENRFLSFAPIRKGVQGLWFVDGASYMSAVADALEAANEDIYISDWWLSPEIYMKRPIFEGERWRLDKILQRKAVRFTSFAFCFTCLTLDFLLERRGESVCVVIQRSEHGPGYQQLLQQTNSHPISF